MIEYVNPDVTQTIAGITYHWTATGLEIELQRLSDEGKGEISVYHNNGNGKELYKHSRISLLDDRGISSIVKSLETNNHEIDWRRVMTYVAGKTIQLLRNGEPVQNINAEPTSKAVKWTLYPWLPDKEPTTIFGPGGKGKSLLADLIACMVSFGVGIAGLDYLRPTKGNVLYLDWERAEDVHKQRITALKRSMGIIDDSHIYYIKCDHHISASIDYLSKKVVELNIRLVIIDSQMAATAGMGHGMSDAEISSEYYNLIRRWNCTTLTIDHTNKASMGEETSSDTPYGSVVKYNRASSIYSVKSTQETESEILSLALKHEKFNLGRKQSARGIEIEFSTSEEGELVGLDFTSFNMADHETFRKSAKQWEIIQAILRENGPMECKAIAEIAKKWDGATKIDTQRASDVMHKKMDVFQEDDKVWSLR